MSGRILSARRLLCVVLLGSAAFTTQAQVSQASFHAEWDSPLNDTIDYEVPFSDGVDLTQGGNADALALSIDASYDGLNPRIILYTGDDNVSDWIRPASSLPTDGALYAPFTDFVAIAGSGADFAHVTRVVITPSEEPIVYGKSAKIQIKAATTLVATMTVEHLDVQVDNEINPGDRLEYTITLTNAGSDETTNTLFNMGVGGNIKIVPGTVSTTNGSVTSGNGVGDTAINVDIPYIGVAPCVSNTTTIKFRADIKLPFDYNNLSVCLQGAVSSANAPSTTTDDPDTATPLDTTCVDVILPDGGQICQYNLLNEGFFGGIPGDFTLFNLDGRTPQPAVSYINNAWVATAEPANTENLVAASTSFYLETGESDDWMITREIGLPANARLRWYARTEDPNFRDGYEVRISTSGSSIGNFFVHPPLFSVAQENFGWTLHTLDLSEFAYENVRIAWHNTSNDKYLLYVDGIEICDVTPDTPPACIDTSLYYQPAEKFTNTGFWNLGFTNSNLVRLDDFTTENESIGRITWWGVAFDGITGEPCTRPSEDFRVELYEDDSGTPGALVKTVNAVVTPVETGRSVRLPFTTFYYPELQYTLTLDTPVTLTAGWLLIGTPDGGCVFGWLKSQTGNAYSLNASGDLTSINVDVEDYGFCLTPPLPGEGEGVVEGTPEGVAEGVVEGTPEGVAEGVVEGAPEGVVEGVVEGTPEGVAEGVVEGTPEGVVEGVVEGTPEGVAEGVVEGTPEGVAEGVVEGTPEGVAEGVVEGTPEGVEEGVVEGITEGTPEGTPEGVVEGSLEGSEEGAVDTFHSADQDGNKTVDFSELLRTVQFYNADGISCAIPAESTEDGYLPGPGDESCAPYDGDYAPFDWFISLTEELRMIQFFNSGGYTYCPVGESEDDFCAGP